MDLAGYTKCYRAEATAVQESLADLRHGRYSTEEELHTLLHRFVLHKYLLPQDTEEESLDTLARMSVERTLMLYGASTRPDHAATCEGTTSAMNKKVLLLLSIQQELGVRFDPAEAAGLTTTMDVARLLFYLLAERGHDHET